MNLSQSTNQQPKEISITVAGTSCGGSSYAHRIIAALNEAGKNGSVRIIITDGVKQDAVEASVRKSIRELNTFAYNMGSTDKVKCKVILH